MENTGRTLRKIYISLQGFYVLAILLKLILSYSNLHIAEISVYALFILITPNTMRALLKSSHSDMNEYLRLLLYSIVEVSYLTESIGLIWANFIPVAFILFSLIFFTVLVRVKPSSTPFKPAKLKTI